MTINRVHLIAAGVAVAVLLPSCFGLGWVGGWLWNRPSEQDREAIAALANLRAALAAGPKADTKPTPKQSGGTIGSIPGIALPEQAKPLTVATVPDFVVDFEAFHKEFASNTISAKSKYMGKVLKISGKVGFVSEVNGTYGLLHVRMPAKRPLDYLSTSFECLFDTQAPLVELKGGQNVNVIGRFAGWSRSNAGMFGMESCVIVP